MVIVLVRIIKPILRLNRLICPLLSILPQIQKKRAFCEGYSEIREEKPYPVRNRDIVDESDMMVACPGGPEELRSGTWSTIRYAHKQGKEVLILMPEEDES